MIFIDNKFTNRYFKIINTAQNRLADKNIYCEKHHIIPKSFGGSDNSDNLVKLTFREHFVCHKLLIKMTEDPELRRKAQYALNSFIRSSKGQERYLTSRDYETIRTEVSNARSEANKGNKYGTANKGKKITDPDRLAVIKQAANDRNKDKLTCPHCGKTVNKGAYKRYHGDCCRLNPNRDTSIIEGPTERGLSEETKQKMRKPKSASHCANISKARKGVPASEKAKKNANGAFKHKITCPHCGKVGNVPNMKRYHFDHCYLNPENPDYNPNKYTKVSTKQNLTTPWWHSEILRLEVKSFVQPDWPDVTPGRLKGIPRGQKRKLS